MVSTPPLRVLTWNAYHLSNKIGELRELVGRISPDIVLVQETKLKAPMKVSIPNYTCYRDDSQDPTPQCPLPKHGTAIFIRSTITHYSIPTPNFTYFQATTIQFHIRGFNPITLACIYINNHPGRGLISELESLTNPHNHMILAGDFNAKHRRWSKNYNRAGSLLSDFADNNSFLILAPPTPTRFGYNSKSTIDLVLTRNIPFHHKISALPELRSDHDPVMCDFFLNLDIPRAAKLYKTNWSTFTENLTNINPSVDIGNSDQLNAAVSDLSNAILNAHSNATRIMDSKSEIYTPPHIKELIKLKNRLRRIWQMHRDPRDKMELNRVQNLIKREVHAHIQQDWHDYLTSLDPQDGSLFRATKRCKRANFRIPPLHDSNNIAYSDDAKAEILADAYEEQFQNNPSTDPVFDTIINTNVQTFLATPHNDEIPPVDPTEITDYIAKIQIKKAPGREGITNKMIKNLPPNVILVIATILTAMLKTCTFPSAWKSAVIIPILKPGKDASNPVSYRPISLLPILGKIAEVIIKNRLMSFLEENNIIIPQQFGFRKQLSTTHQLLRVTEFIAEGFANKQSVGALFLDVSKAFDKVYVPGLIHKLISYQMPPYLITIIRSYLINRNFVVQVKNSYSTPREVMAGTPQGSVLGPTLFLLYINDIPIRPPNMIALFADDTAILSRGKLQTNIIRHLQQHIYELETWLSRWRIQINVDKSAAVMFTRTLTPTPANLKMYGTDIQWTKSTKYLGVMLDSRLTWKPHLEYITDKFRKVCFCLNYLLGRNSLLNLTNKLLIYKVILRPTLTYAAPVWGGACKTTIDRFERLQNTTIRYRVVNANRYMRNVDILRSLELPSLREFISKNATKFFAGLDLIDNPEIARLAYDDYDYTHPRYVHRPRASLGLADV